MKTFRLELPSRLVISFSVAFSMNLFSSVAFILHCDSPRSWVCVFEYIGLPGLLIGYIIPEAAFAFPYLTLASVFIFSFLGWAWAVERTLKLLFDRHAEPLPTAV